MRLRLLVPLPCCHALPCAVLPHSPPSLPMMPHALPETIAACCTLPKDYGPCDNADMVTDAADHGSQSSLSSPVSHPYLHPSSLNPHSHLAVSLCAGIVKYLLAHGHVGCGALWGPHPFSPQAQSHASGSAAVAPSATLASSTLVVLLAEAGASAAWCSKTAQGRARAYASAAKIALDRAQYDAAT